jgi:hypothetical protein
MGASEYANLADPQNAGGTAVIRYGKSTLYAVVEYVQLGRGQLPDVQPVYTIQIVHVTTP